MDSSLSTPAFVSQPPPTLAPTPTSLSSLNSISQRHSCSLFRTTNRHHHHHHHHHHQYPYNDGNNNSNKSHLPIVISASSAGATTSQSPSSSSVPESAITSTVQTLYDVYPYPPDPIVDEAPLGYNWRWHFPSAYAFSSGRAPSQEQMDGLRILDAGCGTGCGTEYLVHLNPTAQVVAFDLSEGALKVARERVETSCGKEQVEKRVTFLQKSIFDINDGEIQGKFDLINCVGVIHHTPDPLRALKQLIKLLKPGGILHIFVYAQYGRHEITLVQEALRIIQQKKNKGDQIDFKQAVALGRDLFKVLPKGNRLRVREETRWAAENMRDSNFADMYCHPQEIDYTVPSVLKLVKDAGGVEFLGFSNPKNFDLTTLVGDSPEWMKRIDNLSEEDRLHLVELLDPERVTHFEFFLAAPPFKRYTWKDDAQLKAAKPEISKCLNGWPADFVFDRDYMPYKLQKDEYEFMKAIDAGANTVQEALEVVDISLDHVRDLVTKSFIMLTPHE